MRLGTVLLFGLGAVAVGGLGLAIGAAAPWKGQGSTSGGSTNGSPPAQAGANWTTQDPTASDVTLNANDWMAVIAKVKTSHDAASIAGLAQKYGLTFYDFRDPTTVQDPLPADPGSGYRYIAAIRQASRDVTVPLRAPWPFGAVDGSEVVSLMVAPSVAG